MDRISEPGFYWHSALDCNQAGQAACDATPVSPKTIGRLYSHAAVQGMIIVMETFIPAAQKIVSARTSLNQVAATFSRVEMAPGTVNPCLSG